MKNILFIAIMLTALTGYANELKPTSLIKNVTTITFNNVKKGQRLSIKDLNENTLYAENIAATGFYKQYFDLTSLENGSYTIVLDQDTQIITRYFDVLEQVVTFNAGKDQVFNKPIAAVRGSQLFISQLTSSDEALDVNIYYNNELIHEDVLSDSSILNRIYQLDASRKGDYYIVMKSDNKTFSKSFSF